MTIAWFILPLAPLAQQAQNRLAHRQFWGGGAVWHPR